MIDNKNKIFKNKKNLIVEDDVRNIFSLTFLLEEGGIDSNC
jgi:hypothetical protein